MYLMTVFLVIFALFALPLNATKKIGLIYSNGNDNTEFLLLCYNRQVIDRFHEINKFQKFIIESGNPRFGSVL